MPATGEITRMRFSVPGLQPLPGYELRSLSRATDGWWRTSNTRSIYGGLGRQLEREGLIEEVERTRTGNDRSGPNTGQRPKPRTLRHLLAMSSRRLEVSARPIDVALSFLWYLPIDEVVSL